MAKQSGLHQLRGKVGEHSYYRQTGIASGLVRSINQGMSARVKTDAAFVNTRLNNAEFGQGGRLASVVAQYITPKYRPMILPFSQSKMAKILLEYLKTDSTAPWGQRNLTASNSAEAQVVALNSVAKNRFEDFGLSIDIDEEGTTLSVTASTETDSKLTAIGADGINFKFLAATTWVGTFIASNNEYADSYPRANIYQNNLTYPMSGDGFDISYALRPVPPEGWPAFQAGRMGVLIVLPYRNVNGNQYTLQENCSFIAFALKDGAVN